MLARLVVARYSIQTVLFTKLDNELAVLKEEYQNDFDNNNNKGLFLKVCR